VRNKILNRNGSRAQLNPGGNHERHSRHNGGIIGDDRKNLYRLSSVGKLTDMIPRLAGRCMAFGKMGVDDSLVVV
jgi:hypothetical protein